MLALPGRIPAAGAGIQADIKTITALGGYAATAITALTAQDTLGVHAIHWCRRTSSRARSSVVLDDIGADAIKTGMLGDAATIEAVAGALARHAPGVPLVVDPVMVAKGGASLLRARRDRRPQPAAAADGQRAHAEPARGRGAVRPRHPATSMRCAAPPRRCCGWACRRCC